MFFIAEVTFFSHKREHLPLNGYRPHAVFDIRKEYWGIKFIELSVIGFDIPTQCFIQFTFQDSLYDEIELNQTFRIMEGPHCVGEGRVLSIEK